MSAPAGYTALDFVGFTDKGPFSDTAKYMKNDLVHDNSNNIWKCKLDDTIGQALVAGTYWELWLNSTNSLANMTDTDISSPANGQTVFYNSTKGKWENKAIGYVDGERAIIGAV